MTTQQFIEKAKQIHGDKYDYSKVDYVNARTKVCIICPEHGEFWQTPDKHLNRKQGCNECAKAIRAEKRRLTLESFIKQSNLKHNNKYDYSKVVYINSRTKVCIICPEHGEFWQAPANHLCGQGCPMCKNVSISERSKDTKETFIEKCKKKYGDIYDYSKVNYKNTKTPVCIICHKHGEFFVKPNDFLQKTECPQCKHEKFISNKRIRFSEFQKRANAIHDNKYTYIEESFIDMSHKMCYICPLHGLQEQLACLHVRTKNPQGCPVCKESHLERDIRLFLEKNNIKYIYQYRPIWLKNKNAQQSIDFLLTDYNIGIECQGEQHFGLTNFGSKNKAFNFYEKIRNRDIKKKKLCEQNKITLIYYTKLPYDNFLGEPLYKNVFEIEQKIKKTILENLT